MIKNRKYFALTIVSLLVLVMTLILPVFGQTVLVTSNKKENNKLSAQIKETIENISDDELIEVWIWRESYPREELRDRMIDVYGKDPDIFENKEEFDKEVLPSIKARVEATYGVVEAHKNILPVTNNDNNSTALKKTRIDEEVDFLLDEYIVQKRSISKEINTEINNAFIERTGVPRENIVFVGLYTSTICLRANKKQILYISDMETVQEITLSEDLDVEPTLVYATEVAGIDCEGGTGYDTDYWLSLLGMNIRVGVLEANKDDGNVLAGKIQSSHPQVGSNMHYVPNIVDNQYTVPAAEGHHATIVCNIIAGQSYTINGTTYRGIVPSATIYETAADSPNAIISGLHLLAEQNVTVINISLSTGSNAAYYDIAREINKMVWDNNITVVCAAGNHGDNGYYVTNEGRSMNAITVGNAKTRLYNTLYTAPFEIYTDDYGGTSAYLEAESFFPNKPDISAPGTMQIPIHINGNNAVVFDKGTSFSAPIISGIIAQMQDYSSWYKMNPVAAKAALLNGAKPSKMITNTDTLSGPNFYNKCGAGFVDAISAIRDSNNFYNITVGTTPNSYVDTAHFYLEEGQTIRAVLVYAKNNNVILTSNASTRDNLDLELRSYTYWDYCFESSNSPYNNVEIIEYTVEDEGAYYFRIKTVNVADPSNPPLVAVSYSIH